MRWDVVGFVLGWTIRLVALPLALVAAYMPIKPAIAEDKAPTAIAVAVYHPNGERPHAMTSAITTGVRILYSVIMKTLAPR